MERIVKTEGIVLKYIKVKEMDAIANIYSKDYGKLRVYINGARNPKSKFVSLRILLFGEFQISLKKNLHKLNSIYIENSYRYVVEDMDKYFMGNYILELFDSSIDYEQVDESLYEMLKYSLMTLNNLENKFLAIFRIFFEYKLLKLLGYSLELQKCSICNLKNKLLSIIDINNGGIICRNCYREANEMLIINFETIKVLNLLLTNPFSVVKNIVINDIIYTELDNVAQKFIKKYLVSKEIKSLSMLLSYNGGGFDGYKFRKN